MKKSTWLLFCLLGSYSALQCGAARLWLSNYVAPWAKRFSFFGASTAYEPVTTPSLAKQVPLLPFSRSMATKNETENEPKMPGFSGPARLSLDIRQLYHNDRAHRNFGTAAWPLQIPLGQTNRYNLQTGMSPLHGAVILRDVQLVRRYIKPGNVDPRDREGQTPLMYAVQEGEIEIARELIAAGADVNARDNKKGRTPLHWVIRMSEGSIKKKGKQIPITKALGLIRLLVDAGADATIKDAEGISVIGQAARWMSDKNGRNAALEILGDSPYARRWRQRFFGQPSMQLGIEGFRPASRLQE